jgi:hypothetical protein
MKTKKKKFATPKRILADLVKYLNNAPVNDAECVWDILCALRGPDMSDAILLKRETTACVRGAIGLSDDRSWAIGATILYDPLPHPYELRSSCDSYHFQKHYKYARTKLQGLGLIDEKGKQLLRRKGM